MPEGFDGVAEFFNLEIPLSKLPDNNAQEIRLVFDNNQR